MESNPTPPERLPPPPPGSSRRYGRSQARNLRRHERGQWELREGLRSRVIELEALLKSKTTPGPLTAGDQVLADQALESLDEAKRALGHEHGRPAAHIAVAQTQLDLAYVILLRLLTLEDITAHLPGIVAFIKEHLPLGDERRARVDEMALSVRGGDTLTEKQREVLIDASTVAHQVHLKEKLRVRSFAHIVFGVTAALAIIAALIAMAGAASPGTVPLCFNPPGMGIVCATATAGTGSAANRDRIAGQSLDEMYADVASKWDYPVVELVGLVAAAVAAAASLRRIHGTSTPYNVPVALALLKLPTGALTALLGLLLMRGDFIPGLSALDSSAQIIAWAVIFGYAQQLFTRFVDSQAQLVLNSVGGPTTNPAKTTRNPSGQPG
ncbi:hypothetical protein [Embleya scabrispora]|uniref:hypothetical protein n=1 Tax=Embleya scabrispora TaxID=159449 RepID=UPI00035ECB3A|nr:hypothetical protein [Embleya scabrispora]MYS84827.1 hypothetical protein [Streptomyces sp. SID5474]